MIFVSVLTALARKASEICGQERPALAVCKHVYDLCEEESEDDNGRDRSHHLSSFNQ